MSQIKLGGLEAHGSKIVQQNVAVYEHGPKDQGLHYRLEDFGVVFKESSKRKHTKKQNIQSQIGIN